MLLQRELELSSWQGALALEGQADHVSLVNKEVGEMKSPLVTGIFLKSFEPLVDKDKLEAYQTKAGGVTTLEEALALTKEYRVFENLVAKLPQNKEEAISLTSNLLADKRFKLAMASIIALALASHGLGAEADFPLQGPQAAPPPDWIEDMVNTLKEKPSIAISGGFGFGLFYGAVTGGIGLADHAMKAAAANQPHGLTLGKAISHMGGSMFGEGVEWGGLAALGALGVNYYKGMSGKPLNTQDIIVMIGSGFAVVTQLKAAISSRLSF